MAFIQRTSLTHKQQKIIFGLYIHSINRLADEEVNTIITIIDNIAGNEAEMFFDFLKEDKNTSEFQSYYNLRSLSKLYKWKKDFYEQCVDCFLQKKYLDELV